MGVLESKSTPGQRAGWEEWVWGLQAGEPQCVRARKICRKLIVVIRVSIRGRWFSRFNLDANSSAFGLPNTHHLKLPQAHMFFFTG